MVQDNELHARLLKTAEGKAADAQAGASHLAVRLAALEMASNAEQPKAQVK